MIFNKLWDGLVAKKPALSDPNTKLEMTSEQLKRMLWKAYCNGKTEGQNVETDRSRETTEDIYGSFMDRLRRGSKI